MSDQIEVIATPWYAAELAALPKQHQVRIVNRVDNLSRKSWSEAIGDRTIAPLRNGIYEVRVLGTGPAYRILFFTVPGRSPRLVVLTACMAKSVMIKRQRLDAALNRASERRAEWIAEQRKREDDAGR